MKTMSFLDRRVEAAIKKSMKGWQGRRDQVKANWTKEERKERSVYVNNGRIPWVVPQVKVVTKEKENSNGYEGQLCDCPYWGTENFT